MRMKCQLSTQGLQVSNPRFFEAQLGVDGGVVLPVL